MESKLGSPARQVNGRPARRLAAGPVTAAELSVRRPACCMSGGGVLACMGICFSVLALGRARGSTGGSGIACSASGRAAGGRRFPPGQGTARVVSQLLADGTGPLYHDGRGNDLGDILEHATLALSRLHPADP